MADPEACISSRELETLTLLSPEEMFVKNKEMIRQSRAAKVLGKMDASRLVLNIFKSQSII